MEFYKRKRWKKPQTWNSTLNHFFTPRLTTSLFLISICTLFFFFFFFFFSSKNSSTHHFFYSFFFFFFFFVKALVLPLRNLFSLISLSLALSLFLSLFRAFLGHGSDTEFPKSISELDNIDLSIFVHVDRLEHLLNLEKIIIKIIFFIIFFNYFFFKWKSNYYMNRIYL